LRVHELCDEMQEVEHSKVSYVKINGIEKVKGHVLLLQFKYRHVLVTWLRAVAEDLHLNNASVHLAVYLLDIFMDNHRIVEERLNLVALVCILLAGLYVWLMIYFIYFTPVILICVSTLKHWLSVSHSCCAQY
jgi:hypothetical protein